MLRALLVLLPAAAVARIDVQLRGKFEDSDSDVDVSYFGSDKGIISDGERQTFKLTDANVKYGAKTYFGKRPNDAYLCSPTPWGDLYLSYKWRQVTRTLYPTSARVLTITSEPQIMMKQIFQNNSTNAATYNVAISQAVENSVSSAWTKNGELTVNMSIGYEFHIGFGSGEASVDMSYVSSWGTSTEKRQTVTIGTSSSVEVVLQPGQAVIAQLQALRGTMKVEVEYEASLSGEVAVNYDDGYKGHHFWALDLNSVMKGATLKNKVTSKELIELGFFGSSKIVIVDNKTLY